MKLRRSLSAKILITAFLNVVMLIAVFLVFARIQYRFDLSSFLLAPARDRILSISRLIALTLEDTDHASWNHVLERYSASHCELFLFDDRGNQYSGNPIALPAQVVGSMHHHHPPRPPWADPGPRPQRPLGEGPVFLVHTANAYWVGTDIPIWPVRNGNIVHGFLIWQFRSLWTNTFFFNYPAWALVILAIVLVSLVCWLPLIRGLTTAISQLTRATGRMAEGHFDTSVPVKRRDELGQLSASINRMNERLSGFVHGQRRFLGDVAHELCSPVARMQAALAILEQRIEGTLGAYVADLQEELQHMSGLINELLLFSKSQISGSNLELVSVNLADTVGRVLEREATPGIAIESRVSPELQVVANPEYLFRSLANVIRNAIRYAGSAGEIAVFARAVDTEVVITVADCGPGLPESELESVFKPFYRPEFARQRETGGVGLGLAIVRNCIEACEGRVRARNRTPHGLELEITLPASTPKDKSTEFSNLTKPAALLK